MRAFLVRMVGGIVRRPPFQLGGFLQGNSWHDTHRRQTVLQSVERAAREAISHLERLEVALHPWVSYVVMPLFAFANAGVPIEAGVFTDSMAMAVVVGLCVGNPLASSCSVGLPCARGWRSSPKGYLERFWPRVEFWLLLALLWHSSLRGWRSVSACCLRRRSAS